MADELQRLDLSFPLWLFDPTSIVHPRKLDWIPADARPAQLTAWYPWHWEYGMYLAKADMTGKTDPPYVQPRTIKPWMKLRPAEDVIKRFQFDESLDEADYKVVMEGGREFGLAEVRKRSLPPGQIESIWRIWDDVPVWDKPARFDTIFGYMIEGYHCDGLAMLVHDAHQLAKLTGVRPQDGKNVPMKAQFELTDEGGGTIKGIIYNGRWHGLDRGIIRGAAKEYNDEILYGTDRESEMGTIGR
jgi:hypothetical protein